MGTDMGCIRIGHGFDVHGFGGPGPCMLCGVQVPHEQGLMAHSDGDVAVHAVCDAILGALALGDIGHFYPDHDERFRGIDSMLLLGDVVRRMQELGYRVGNLDVTVMAQVPRLAPYIERMRGSLAGALQTAVQTVSVKATTTERLGFVGRREGIAAEAVVLLLAAGS